MNSWHVFGLFNLRLGKQADKEGAMENEIAKKIAYLEFVNDQLISEIKCLDELLRAIGFANGLATVKEAARELLKEENEGPELNS